MSDFHETGSSRNGRALVIKHDLDFERLMVESDRRGSHCTSWPGTSSLSSSPCCAPRSESHETWIDDVDSDTDVMSLTSPGLSSPDSSPRSSLTFETSNPELRETGSRTSTSNETLMTEGSGETKTHHREQIDRLPHLQNPIHHPSSNHLYRVPHQSIHQTQMTIHPPLLHHHTLKE